MVAKLRRSGRKTALVLALALAAPTLVCGEGFKWWPKKKTATTDRTQSFTDQARGHANRGVAAPALGHEEPGRVKQFTSSVVDTTKNATGRMSASVKRGARKTANVFRRQDMAPADPTALSTPVEEPNATFYSAVAQMQERAGNLAGAEENYKKALELEPKNLRALLDYAHLHDRQDHFSEATELYRKAVKYHPDSACAYNDLGICLARQNQLLDSMEALNKAVELEPKRNLYRNNLAKVLVKANRPQDAFAQLAQIHSPAVAHYNMGYLLYEQSNLQGAEYHFTQAVGVDPQFAEARQWCDRLAAMRGGTMPAGVDHESLARRPVTVDRLPPSAPAGYAPSAGYAPAAPAGYAPAAPMPPQYAPAGPPIHVPLPPGAGRP